MPSADPVKRRKHSRDYYTRHREEQLTKAATYREAHRAELVERNRLYRLRKRAERAQKTTTEGDHR